MQHKCTQIPIKPCMIRFGIEQPSRLGPENLQNVVLENGKFIKATPAHSETEIFKVYLTNDYTNIFGVVDNCFTYALVFEGVIYPLSAITFDRRGTSFTIETTENKIQLAPDSDVLLIKTGKDSRVRFHI